MLWRMRNSRGRLASRPDENRDALTRQPSRSVFRLSYIGTFYIGVGDQFDDERRLVRETRELPDRPDGGSLSFLALYGRHVVA
jgi:hypothetical protein